MTTILELAKDLADDLSLYEPVSLFPAEFEANEDARKLKNAIQRALRWLHADRDWHALRVKHSWAVGATAATPADYGRIIPGTFWRDQGRFPVHGPLSSEEWASEEQYSTNAGVPHWAEFGGEIQLIPTPQTGEEFSYWYIPKAIAKNGTDAKWKLDDDADVPLWSEELVFLGARTQYLEREGFGTEQGMAEYRKALWDAYSADGGRKTFSMGGASMDRADAMKHDMIASIRAPK